MTDDVMVDRELLANIHDVLALDWKNADVTRRINVLLHPVPEELTVRERVALAMGAAETWGASIDAAIAVIYDAVVRAPAAQPLTTVVSDVNAFMAGTERQRRIIMAMLEPEHHDG